MNRIHKFVLKHGVNKIKMSREYRILNVQNQKGELVLWAIVDPNDPAPGECIFEVYMTGELLTYQRFNNRFDWDEWDRGRENMKYVGTVQFDDGRFVLHVFQNVTGIGAAFID